MARREHEPPKARNVPCCCCRPMDRPLLPRAKSLLLPTDVSLGGLEGAMAVRSHLNAPRGCDPSQTTS